MFIHTLPSSDMLHGPPKCTLELSRIRLSKHPNKQQKRTATVALVTLMTDAGGFVTTKTLRIWDGRMEKGILLN